MYSDKTTSRKGKKGGYWSCTSLTHLSYAHKNLTTILWLLPTIDTVKKADLYSAPNEMKV